MTDKHDKDDKATAKAKAQAVKATPTNLGDFPRMLHRGDERRQVKDKDQLEAARADGFEFHHDPPYADTDVDLASMDADAAATHVQALTDIAQLETLRNAEVGVPKVSDARRKVMLAIDKRISDLRQGNRPASEQPPPPPVAAPASGLAAMQAQIAAAKDRGTLEALATQEANNPDGARPGVLAAIAARQKAI